MIETAPTVRVETITPELATEMLGHNTHNRNLRQPYVERLARAITAGDWQFNGETIKVAADGTIVDGQHRLAAVVESGGSIKTAVIYNVPIESQMTVDTGVRRTLSDVLKLAGHVRYATLAATLVWLYRWETGSIKRRLTSAYPTTAEALRTLDAHPGISESIPFGESTSRVMRVAPSMMVFLHYLFSNIDAEDADDFFAKLIEPVGLSEGSPIIAVRHQFDLEATGAVRRRRSEVHAALLIKAWNAYREGRSVQRINWSGGGSKPESFPVPV